MGTVKDNMKPKSKKGEAFFEKMRGLRKNGKAATKDEEPEVDLSFADHLALSSEKLDEMLEIKERDLKDEPGQRVSNAHKIEVLRSMRFHMNQIAHLCLEI